MNGGVARERRENLILRDTSKSGAGLWRVVATALSPPRLPSGKRRAHLRGSVVFEVLLVAAVLAVGLYVGISVAARWRRHALVDRSAAEILRLTTALEAHRRQLGQWPQAALEGEVPAGLAGFLGAEKWPATSAIGGRYVWTPPTARESATLGITAFSPDAPLVARPADLRAIDALLDDGNLATGRFRAGFNGWPTWRVGP